MNKHSYETRRKGIMKEKDEIELCEDVCVHDEIVHKVEKDMPEETKLYDLAELFKIFGDSTRIKILYVLMQTEMCVCDISEVLGVSQSAVSHQLKALKLAKLVKYRRDGKSILYSLDDEHVRTVISQGIDHIME